MSEFIRKVEELPRDEHFAYRVIQLMEEEVFKSKEMLRKEEEERQCKSRKEFEAWKKKSCPQCKKKYRKAQMNETQLKCFPFVTFYALEPYGVHIEGSCSNCNYIEIF